MIVLLDTHAWLWWVTDDVRLGNVARAIIEDASNTILLSIASAWEIAIKQSLGRLRTGDSPETLIPRLLEESQTGLLAIELRHALKVASLPHHHRDPFDRLLVAQALEEGFPLLTADDALRRYGVVILPAR